MSEQYRSQPCPDCNITFSSDTNLKKHIIKQICKKRKAKKTCDQCGLTFTGARAYRYHKEFDVCKYSKLNNENKNIPDINSRLPSPRLKIKSTEEVQILRDELKDIKNVLNMLVSSMLIQNAQIQTQNAQNIQNIQTQNVKNIQNNISITINFGEEDSEKKLYEKLDLDLNYVLTNHSSNCVPVLSKIMHDGNKYPEYRNIYATDQFPNSVFVWKNGGFVKVNKKKAIDLMIKNKLDTLSEYVDTKENIDDKILDKYLDYREQIEENVIFHKQSVSDINDTLIDIGNNRESQHK